MPVFTGRTLALWLGAAATLASCTTIDRPTGPVETGPPRPHSVIVQPAHDTTISPGHNLNFLVTVTSSTGIDTIYTELSGTTANYPPLADPGSPATFGLTVRTDQMVGNTVLLRVIAVDSLGQPGDTALRFVQIQ